MSEWDSLSNFEDWAQKLDELLEELRLGLSNNGDVSLVQRRLRQFRLNSPLGANFEKLNAVAAKAVKDAAGESVTKAIENIAARSNELDDAIRDLNGVTDTAKRHAKIINLESPTTIVTSLTETVAAFKGLRDTDIQIGEGATEEISKKINTAINAITKLRDAIESAT